VLVPARVNGQSFTLLLFVVGRSIYTYMCTRSFTRSYNNIPTIRQTLKLRFPTRAGSAIAKPSGRNRHLLISYPLPTIVNVAKITKQKRCGFATARGCIENESEGERRAGEHERASVQRGNKTSPRIS